MDEAELLHRGATTAPSRQFQEGLHNLRTAQRLEPDHPFHQLAIGRAEAVLAGPDGERKWQRVSVELSELSDAIRAHVSLTNSQVARRRGAYVAAIGEAGVALSTWIAMPFPQGVLRASWELARCHVSSGRREDRVAAGKYLILCGHLAQRLQDPSREEILRWEQALFSSCNMPRRDELLESVELEYSAVLRRTTVPPTLASVIGERPHG